MAHSEELARTPLELAVFTALRHGPVSEARLAKRLGLDPGPAHTLIDSLVSQGLLERRDGRCANIDAIDSILERAEGLNSCLPGMLSRLLPPVLALAVAALALQASWRPDPRPLTPGRGSVASAGPGVESVADTHMQETGPAFYLVASRDEAESMNDGLNTDDIPGARGEIVTTGSSEEAAAATEASAGDWIFDVVDSPLAEARTRDLVAGANAMRAADHKRPLQIVDLRSLFTLPNVR